MAASTQPPAPSRSRLLHLATGGLWVRPWKPDLQTLAQVDAAHADAPWTYAQRGATQGAMPEGWTHQEVWAPVGQGRASFEAARSALQRYAHFDLGWVTPLSHDVPLVPGERFTFASYQLGVWVISVCRIVYVLDEPDAAIARFGYAYGTIGDHAIRGEERFLVEWDKQTDAVRFGVKKFSLPANWLSRLTGPLTRGVQQRFTAQAIARIQESAA